MWSVGFLGIWFIIGSHQPMNSEFPLASQIATLDAPVGPRAGLASAYVQQHCQDWQSHFHLVGPPLRLNGARLQGGRLVNGSLSLLPLGPGGQWSKLSCSTKKAQVQRGDKRKGGNGSGCPTALARRLLREDALGASAQMGKGRPFLPAVLWLSPLAAAQEVRRLSACRS